jgi:hypothetical protein
MCFWPVVLPMSLELGTVFGSVLGADSTAGTTSLAGRRKISAETQGPCGRHTVCIAQGLPPRYGRQQLQRQLEEGYGELQTRSILTGLGHAPANGSSSHLACASGPAEGRRISVSKYLPSHTSLTTTMYAQTLAEQSQRSIGARVELKCLCVFDLSCPGRHPHASSTSYKLPCCWPATFERPVQTPS